MQGASKAANWIVGWQPQLDVDSEARTHGLSISGTGEGCWCHAWDQTVESHSVRASSRNRNPEKEIKAYLGVLPGKWPHILFAQNIHEHFEWPLRRAERRFSKVWFAEYFESYQPYLPFIHYPPFLTKALVMSVVVQEYNLPRVPGPSSFANHPSQEKHRNSQSLSCGLAKAF